MSTFSPLELAAFLVALSLLVKHLYRSRSFRSYPLPPGPRKLPLIGNFFDVPSEYAWKQWAEWGKMYDSDIIHLNLIGHSIVILNSYEAAKELLEKRSVIYSSRPQSTMLSELSGFGFQFGLMPYGEPWRIRRRLFKTYFSPKNSIIYELQEEKYVHRLLHQLLGNPKNISHLLAHLTGAIALSMTYGMDILPENDPNLRTTELATKTIEESLTVGSVTVDAVPILKYLPSWFPGAGFQKVAANTRVHASRVRDGIFQDAYNKWSTRMIPNPSFVSLALEDYYDKADEEQMTVLKDVGGNVYMAAASTTTSFLLTFILAMTCYPEIQKRAQQELDKVVGTSRLPNHTDAPELPYITALVKEVLRWQPSVPGGLAHMTTAPDIYKGYYIPQGSSVTFNVWAMCNNEADYPEPQGFKPERFLTSDGQLRPSSEVRDPVEIAFGFGRRICPGTHIGLSVVWITVASILTTFNIEKALDCNGKPIEPTRGHTSAAVSVPLPFECSIKPRSQESISLVQAIKENTTE